MDANYEAFVLYYTAFQAFELNTKEFREMLVSDIGEDGFEQAIAIFRQERLNRESVGDKRTLHEVMNPPKEETNEKITNIA